MTPYTFLKNRLESKFLDDTFFDEYPKSFALLSIKSEIISTEIKELIGRNKVKPVPYFNKAIVNTIGNWQTLGFYFWGMPTSLKNIQLCPNTIRILNQIPGMVSASVSIMKPNTEIKPHYGDTDASYRIHLGIQIPGELPKCGIRVGFEDRPWKEKELLVFNDAAYHKAWNFTNEERIVLIVDVIRPEFIKEQKKICLKMQHILLKQWINSKF